MIYRSVYRLFTRGNVALLLSLWAVLSSRKKQRKSRSLVMTEANAVSGIGGSSSVSAADSAVTGGAAVSASSQRAGWRSKLKERMWGSTGKRIWTILLVVYFLYALMVVMGYWRWPWTYWRDHQAMAGVVGQPDISYPLSSTLMVSVPHIGSFATDYPDKVVWYPYADQEEYVEVAKATYEQDNFENDAETKLKNSNASRIHSDKAGTWQYVIGKVGGRYMFEAYSVPCMLAASSAQKSEPLRPCRRRSPASTPSFHHLTPRHAPQEAGAAPPDLRVRQAQELDVDGPVAGNAGNHQSVSQTSSSMHRRPIAARLVVFGQQPGRSDCTCFSLRVSRSDRQCPFQQLECDFTR
jgi:hypothetical protein